MPALEWQRSPAGSLLFVLLGISVPRHLDSLMTEAHVLLGGFHPTGYRGFLSSWEGLPQPSFTAVLNGKIIKKISGHSFRSSRRRHETHIDKRAGAHLLKEYLSPVTFGLAETELVCVLSHVAFYDSFSMKTLHIYFRI